LAVVRIEDTPPRKVTRNNPPVARSQDRQSFHYLRQKAEQSGPSDCFMDHRRGRGSGLSEPRPQREPRCSGAEL